MPQIIGGWWHHRQTAKAPKDQVSAGAFQFLLKEALMDFSGGYIIKTWFMACGKKSDYKTNFTRLKHVR